MKKTLLAILFAGLSAAAFAEPVKYYTGVFQEADLQKGDIMKITAKDQVKGGSGVNFSVPRAEENAKYRFSCEVRGNGNLEGMYYSSVLKRRNIKYVKLSGDWQKMEAEATLPAGKNGNLNFTIFFWKQPKAMAEIRNLVIEKL